MTDSGRKVRFETQLSFEEHILMMSLAASGVPKKFFMLGVLHARLIQQTSTPIEDVFGASTKDCITGYGEVSKRCHIDLRVSVQTAEIMIQIKGCSEVKV